MVPAPPASWYTPARLLALFCVMSLLIYLDRGVISSAAVSGAPATASSPGSGLQGDFRVGYELYGALQAAFMLGLLLGCPVFSSLAKHSANPFRLIAVGLWIWVASTLACAAAPSYAFLFLARCAVGAGEASFCALAAPFIDDVAPKARKTRWLAVFYLCIPVGVASGFIYGGSVGANLGWRWAFAIESAAMAPVAAFCSACAPVPLNAPEEEDAEPPRGGAPRETSDSDPSGFSGGAASSPRGERSGPPRRRRGVAFAAFAASVRGFARDVLDLARVPAYVTVLVGYVFYTAVVGVYAVWGPKAAFGVFGGAAEGGLERPSEADFALGVVTVVAGVFGTLLGGFAVDHFARKYPSASGVRVAAGICAVSAVTAFAFLECAFRAPTFAAFVAVFFVGQSLVFVVQAPVNAAVLWSVRPEQRPLACSMTTVFVHLLGDVPTPPMFGVALGREPEAGDWRAALGGFTVAMLVAAAAFGAAAVARFGAGREGNEGNAEAVEEGRERREGGEEEEAAEAEAEASAPLLGRG